MTKFGFLSGTSMAAPHVAGFGALLLGKNPNWSPATVKSAMMTTAGNVVNADGSKNTDVLATGAGQVDPARMVDPGLVYDANERTTGNSSRVRESTSASRVGSILPRDMNVPSFSLGNLTGKIAVTRTLTALTPGVYKVKANVPGIQVNVAPAALNFKAAGEKKTVQGQL